MSLVQSQIKEKQTAIKVGKKASSLSVDNQKAYFGVIAALENGIAILKTKSPENDDVAFKLLKADYDDRTKTLKKLQKKQVRSYLMFSNSVKKCLPKDRKYSF